jgi:hypothetical protein
MSEPKPSRTREDALLLNDFQMESRLRFYYMLHFLIPSKIRGPK